MGMFPAILSPHLSHPHPPLTSHKLEFPTTRVSVEERQERQQHLNIDKIVKFTVELNFKINRRFPIQ